MKFRGLSGASDQTQKVKCIESQLCGQAKAATKEYKNAVQNNAKGAHDALATATAKGVDDAHVKVTSGSSAYSSAGAGAADGSGAEKHILFNLCGFPSCLSCSDPACLTVAEVYLPSFNFESRVKRDIRLACLLGKGKLCDSDKGPLHLAGSYLRRVKILG